MRSTIGNIDQQFLARLNRLGDSTVQELCEAFEVTPTAVRERLTRLLTRRLVERETVPATRGRPYHVYRVTPEGRRQLGDDYTELVQVLWREVREIEDQNVRERLLDRVRRSFVDRYKAEGSTDSIVDRFEQLRATLDREGFEVEVETRASDDGLLPILREHCCPYHDLAAEDSSICDLEQSVFEEVLGVPVKLTQCCRDGDSCCEFEAVTTG